MVKPRTFLIAFILVQACSGQAVTYDYNPAASVDPNTNFNGYGNDALERFQSNGLFYDLGATPGLNFFAPQWGINSFIVNNKGKVLKKWTEPDGYALGGTALLTDEGTLLRGVRPKVEIVDDYFRPLRRAHGNLREYDKDGRCIWEFRLNTGLNRVKGDFVIMPSGNVLAVVTERTPVGRARARGYTGDGIAPGINFFWSDSLIEIPRIGQVNTQYDPDAMPGDDNPFNTCMTYSGEDDVVWKWDFIEHTSGDPRINAWDINKEWEISAVDYLPYRDHIIMMCRPCGEVFIVDHSRLYRDKRFRKGDFIYRWGNPANYKRSGPAKLTADNVMWVRDNYGWNFIHHGKVMVYNNEDPLIGGNQTASSIVQFEPPFYKGRYLIYKDGTYGPKDFDFKVVQVQQKIPEWAFDYQGPGVGDTADGNFARENNGFPDNGAGFGNSGRSIRGGFKYPWKNIYSRLLGYAQKLPNNHILVTSSYDSEVLELALYDRVIWKYVSPYYASGLDNNIQGEDCELGWRARIPYCVFREAPCNAHDKMIKYSLNFKGFEFLFGNSTNYYA